MYLFIGALTLPPDFRYITQLHQPSLTKFEHQSNTEHNTGPATSSPCGLPVQSVDELRCEPELAAFQDVKSINVTQLTLDFRQI